MPQSRRGVERTPESRRLPSADSAPRPGRRRPEVEADAAPARRSGSDLSKRVIVAVPAALVAIGFCDLGGTGWTLLMALFAVLGLIELYKMLARWKPEPYVGFVIAVGMCAAARFGGLRDTIAVALLALPVLLAIIASRPSIKDGTVSIAGTLLGIFWLGIAFSHAVLLRQLPHGGGVVIDMMVGTFFGDIGAYFGGRAFGNRKLAPDLSPNKTVEGLIVGMITAIVVVFIAHLYQSGWMNEPQALGLGIACAVLGPLGDLFESLVKREAGVKDSGNLFGAHGGVLDRLDAVAFTIVAGYYIWAAAPH
jgi:phosphatidate cytidylyltransferase